ncbi:MAG: glycohydrolase toxin TNT-related protein [Paludibacteraceae bacterium]|nr:glycohydrolase toxin TNT-related protein [Paludibacteraceae bacterium]
MADLFEEYFQKKLKNAYNALHKKALDLENLVADLKTTYAASSRDFRGDTLIPHSANYIDTNDEPISVIRDDKGTELYSIVYRWNQNFTSDQCNEFIADGLTRHATIPVGTSLDRLGSTRGRFVCLREESAVSSVESRAIPYEFLEGSLVLEPSYHHYRVIKEISEEAIITSIENDIHNEVFPDDISRKRAVELVKNRGIIVGITAPVTAFECQGIGGSKQYRLPISIYYFIAFGFLHEVEK